MITVSKPTACAPSSAEGTQALIYRRLSELGIPFERVDCSPAAVSMEDCRAIDDALGCPTVKSVFLRNRQGTAHYLYVTDGSRPFVTRDFCSALGVPRVSFTSADEMLQMLGTDHGAATPLAIIADRDSHVRLVIDRAIATLPHIACPDATATTYLRLSTADLLDRYLPSTAHTPDQI